MIKRLYHEKYRFNCPKCKKAVLAKNNIICDLKKEKFAALGALCRNCRQPVTKICYDVHHIELPPYIERRQVDMSCADYINKYNREWPEIMDESTASEYCGLKLIAMRNLFKRSGSPQKHQIGYIAYWRQDLDEWLKHKE